LTETRQNSEPVCLRTDARATLSAPPFNQPVARLPGLQRRYDVTAARSGISLRQDVLEPPPRLGPGEFGSPRSCSPVHSSQIPRFDSAPIARTLIALGGENGSIAIKTQKGEVVIQQLDEVRYAVAVDGLVRYVGTQEECERRVAILVPKNDRAAQDQALTRLSRLL
jgi:hypothetical protein